MSKTLLSTDEAEMNKIIRTRRVSLLSVVLAVMASYFYSGGLLFARNQGVNKRIGSTYVTDKGGDLDKLLQRSSTKDKEGRFTISVTGDLPKYSAKLSVYAFDVDEERGELVTFFLNGHFLGNLSGTNDSWNTTVFDVRKEWVKKGLNRVRFVIADSSPKGTIRWSGKVGWGQLLIDGGSSDRAEIVSQTIREEGKGRIAYPVLESQILIKKEGVFHLEFNVVDSKGNAVLSGEKEFSSTSKRKVTIPFTITLSSRAAPEKMKTVTNLFVKDGATLVQQDVKTLVFQRKRRKEEVRNRLILVTPLRDVRVSKNAPDQMIDVARLFALRNSLEDNVDIPIKKEVFYNNNKELVEAKMVGENVRLRFQKDAFGQARIAIRGSSNGLSATDSFLIDVSPITVPLIPTITSPSTRPISTTKPVGIPSDIKPEQAITPNGDHGLNGRYYVRGGIGIHQLYGYLSTSFFALTVGKEVDAILKNVSLEVVLFRTLYPHERRSFGKLSSRIDITILGIFARYTLYSQHPGLFDLFRENPLNVRMKVGVVSTRFNENASGSDTDERYREGKVNLGASLTLAHRVTPESELFLEFSKGGEALSSVLVGYCRYF